MASCLSRGFPEASKGEGTKWASRARLGTWSSREGGPMVDTRAAPSQHPAALFVYTRRVSDIKMRVFWETLLHLNWRRGQLSLLSLPLHHCHTWGRATKCWDEGRKGESPPSHHCACIPGCPWKPLAWAAGPTCSCTWARVRILTLAQSQ